MNNSSDPLELIGAGLLLVVLASLAIVFHDDVAWKRRINVTIAAGGFLIGCGILVAPSMAGTRHFIQALTIFGVNVALTGAVWAGLIAWYEGFKSSRVGTDYGGHYIRTRVTTLTAALLLPLWTATHLTFQSVGILLLGVAAVLAVKAKGETPRVRRVAVLLAILGGLGIAGDVAGYLGVFTKYEIYHLPIFYFLLAALVVILYFSVWHRDQNKHHHIWSPVAGVAFAVCLVVVGGVVFTNMISHGARDTVTTVTHMTGHGSGGTGNPFAPAAKDLGNALDKALHHHG
jgi:hypothetical protein